MSRDDIDIFDILAAGGALKRDVDASAAIDAKNLAEAAALTAQGAAGAVRGIVNTDILFDGLFPFVAKGADGQDRLIGYAEAYDGAWVLTLAQLALRGGFKLAIVETVETGSLYVLAPDGQGGYVILQQWPEEPTDETTVEQKQIETTEGGSGRGAFMIQSADGGILFQEDTVTPVEMAIARGSQANLNARLSIQMNAQGLPTTAYYNRERLRQTHHRLSALKAGVNIQCHIGAFGDSFTDNQERWITKFANRMVAEYGDGGGGWTSFACFDYNAGTGIATYLRGNARPDRYPVTLSGPWTSGSAHRFVSYGPDTGRIRATAAGAKVTVGIPSTPQLSVCTFFAEGTANGVSRYRWNGGAWTTINLQPVGPVRVDLTGFPTGVDLVLEIETVSGQNDYNGVNLKSDAPGVVIHKLAGAGEHLYETVAVNAVNWQSNIAALGLHVGQMMIGTNDQSADQPATVFANNMSVFWSRFSIAAPYADKAIVMPPENNRGVDNTIPMKAYQDACYPLAVSINTAWLNLQPIFGPDPTEYAFDGPRPLFDNDKVHPSQNGGGALMFGAIYDLYTKF